MGQPAQGEARGPGEPCLSQPLTTAINYTGRAGSREAGQVHQAIHRLPRASGGAAAHLRRRGAALPESGAAPCGLGGSRKKKLQQQRPLKSRLVPKGSTSLSRRELCRQCRRVGVPSPVRPPPRSPSSLAAETPAPGSPAMPVGERKARRKRLPDPFRALRRRLRRPPAAGTGRRWRQPRAEPSWWRHPRGGP